MATDKDLENALDRVFHQMGGTGPNPVSSQIKNLGKTILQIEREQLARNRQMIVLPSDVNNRCYEQTPLSADECAIAVNDPNGCASFLRQLADQIEGGLHVGIQYVDVFVSLTKGRVRSFRSDKK